MNRNEFIKQSAFGLAAGVAVTKALPGFPQDNDELREILGFNHIPNPNSTVMENIIIHKADSRGHANHGWLDSHHTFSFANYYNPERMHFGVLRVLNDDIIDGGTGFGTHPHNNMEIISIPLEGALEHKDSMGNTSVIAQGDVQVMTAGTGIEHSEYNKNKDARAKFLQIWVFPREKGLTPRYDQLTFNVKDRSNKLQQILSPSVEDEGVWIHQDAWFHLGNFTPGFSTTYHLKKSGNGVYVFVISGSVAVANQQLNARDGAGIRDASSVELHATSACEILVMEVPMNIN